MGKKLKKNFTEIERRGTLREPKLTLVNE